MQCRQPRRNPHDRGRWPIQARAQSDRQPFTTFTIPGLILLVVVGDTQLASAMLLCNQRVPALLWSAVADFKILIWTISEIGLIHAFTHRQTIYVVSGCSSLA